LWEGDFGANLARSA